MTPKKPKIIVTSALPYANGSIHIGHLVEYLQTDMLVRFMKSMGEDVVYCCADDTHGAPITIKAKQLKITPEELITRMHNEHLDDFRSFGIDFDSYYTTNSEENRLLVEEIFRRLQAKNMIYAKDMNLPFCEKCAHFLPDRYVKGTCPKCGAEDQYGDNCESCGATYEPTDLSDPRCAICKNTPIIKQTNHFFFKLSEMSDWLAEWLRTSDIQESMKNQCMHWIEKGLDDWCISRDPPYFGFRIPDSDKYFYVWLDAPVGYLSSLANYMDIKDTSVLNVWNEMEARHYIGKDIIYFHLLFWPAILQASNLKPPEKVHVHGFLRVNGAKMSKSRGTFIQAKEALKLMKPDHLRFYYASVLSDSVTDMDLDLEKYHERINSVLVGKIANYFYRTLHFLDKHFDGRINEHEDATIQEEADKILESAISAYKKNNLMKATADIVAFADLANKYFQDNAPWESIKQDKEQTHKVLSYCLKLGTILNELVAPITPGFSEKVRQQLNCDFSLKEKAWNRQDRIGKPSILEKKIEPVKIALKEDAVPDFRTGLIISAEPVPKSDKLFELKVDVGEQTPRNVVAGLRAYYSSDQLVNRKAVFLCNIKKRKVMKRPSEAMILAVESKDKQVGLLQWQNGSPGAQVSYNKQATPSKEITYKDFEALKISVKSAKVVYADQILKTDEEDISVDRDIQGMVC